MNILQRRRMAESNAPHEADIPDLPRALGLHRGCLTCGHVELVHETESSGRCTLLDCGCREYREPDDPRLADSLATEETLG